MTDAAPEPGNSFTITRILKAPAERIYRAFLDPAAIAKWNTPYGFTATVYHLEAVEGGQFRMAFTNFGTQETHAFSGVYTELQPHRRIRTAVGFDDPAIPGQLTTTVDIEETIVGARLTVTQAGLLPQIPPEYAILGWQESLDQLKMLVEPEIPSAG